MEGLTMPTNRHPARSARRWFSRLTARAKTAVLALCLVIVAAAGFGVYQGATSVFGPHPDCLVQGATVVRHAGPNAECVGITDGSFLFDPALKGIEKQISTEDQEITSAHPADYVSVVMLLPISSASGSILSITNVLEQLRGAYTAQNAENTTDIGGNGRTPYIQLLIGNDGYQADQWQGAVGIVENAVTAEHVAAVAGIGVSLATTQDAVLSLTRHDIPVFGATITSDSFDNIKDLVRVAPSNSTEVSVALSYIKALYTKAIIVEDQNTGDTYDSTLVTGFEKFADATHHFVDTAPYDTTQRDQAQSAAAEQQAEQSVQAQIAQMPGNICVAEESGPAAVLFAGRGSDLAQLVTDLADRPCATVPITIISGDDVTNVPFSSGVGAGLKSGVTVDYVGVANPDEWNQGTGAAIAADRGAFQAFEQSFDQLFPGGSLTDGNTMMAYDAVLTGVSAIRLTKENQPQPYAVAGMLGALQAKNTVLGASGPITFDANYSNSTFASNPFNKPIPVLRLGQNGAAQFLELDWPSGTPFS
jgi:hypothetical protein